MSPFLGEIVGTALLVLLGDAVVANVLLAKTKGNNSGWIVITTGWALAIFAGALAVGSISGAHMNPAVTIGLAIAGKFDPAGGHFTGWDQVPIYIIGQFIGAFIGAILVWLAYYPHWAETTDPGLKLGVFATGPAIRTPLWNVVGEAIGTFVLVFGILAIKSASMPGSTNGSTVQISLGAIGVLPVAFLIWAIGLSLGGPTGYAINPARDLGPRIIHFLLPIPGKGGSDWAYAWIPVVGPVIGGIVAAALYIVLGRF